jgi:hypothetical protein
LWWAAVNRASASVLVAGANEIILSSEFLKHVRREVEVESRDVPTKHEGTWAAFRVLKTKSPAELRGRRFRGLSGEQQVSMLLSFIGDSSQFRFAGGSGQSLARASSLPAPAANAFRRGEVSSPAFSLLMARAQSF